MNNIVEVPANQNSFFLYLLNNNLYDLFNFPEVCVCPLYQPNPDDEDTDEEFESEVLVRGAKSGKPAMEFTLKHVLKHGVSMSKEDFTKIIEPWIIENPSLTKLYKKVLEKAKFKL